MFPVVPDSKLLFTLKVIFAISVLALAVAVSATIVVDFVGSYVTVHQFNPVTVADSNTLLSYSNVP